jgi:hypothetical protein
LEQAHDLDRGKIAWSGSGAALSLWTPQNTLAVEELRPMDFISSLVI